MNLNNYKCAVCGKQNVKLWRPYMDTAPRICAVCAEEHQSKMDYREVIWHKNADGGYTGKFTDQKLPLPRWTVDENGLVPDYMGPGPEGMPQQKTDQLIVDLSKISDRYGSGKTTMVPACQRDEDGVFCGYSSVPYEICKDWKALPTR